MYVSGRSGDKNNGADKNCAGLWFAIHRVMVGRALEAAGLALLWQIYLRCFALQIHFLQYGHRCGGGRATNSTMAWRTAGSVG